MYWFEIKDEGNEPVEKAVGYWVLTVGTAAQKATSQHG
jgi:hypothetical protein